MADARAVLAVEVVDLDDPGVAPPRGAPRTTLPGPVARQWRSARPTERRLAVAVAVLLLAGIGSVRQLGLPPVAPAVAADAPAAAEPARAETPVRPPASRLPGVASVRGSGTRLLLVGSGVTAYDVDAASATVVLSNAPGLVPIVDAAAIKGADVVLASSRGGPRVPGQVTLSLPGGSAPREVGVGTRLVAARRADAVWVVTVQPGRPSEQVRLLTAAGTIAAGPFTLPDDGDLVGELPTGLVTRAAGEAGEHPLELLTVGGRLIRHLTLDSADASVGGDLLTVLQPTGSITGDDGSERGVADGTHPVLTAASGDLAFDGHDGLRVLRVGSRTPLLFPSPANGCPPVWGPTGWLFVTVGAGVAALAPTGTTLRMLPSSFSDVPLCVDAAAAAGEVSGTGDGSDGDGRPGARAALAPTPVR